MGALIGLVTIYYTYLQYKRSIFQKNELLSWSLVWTALIGISFVSMFVIPLKQTIYIYSLLDLVIFASILGGYVILLIIHRRQNILDGRVKRLIREAAFESADGKRKG
jgi:hypothetical protein